MTITYSYSCSEAGFGTFLKLLFRWRGSIYKLIYKESVAYLALYYALHFTYKFGLKGYNREQFDQLVVFCGKSHALIPITFILGFYVAQVISRWWNIFMSIAWPDKAAELASSHITGSSDDARMIRRSIVRYLNCSQLLVLRDITSAVKKRFPTLDHLVEGGFLTLTEREKLETTECSHHKYWIPIHWCHVLLFKARHKRLIQSDYYHQKLMEAVNEFKSLVGLLFSYDWIPIPLVYTQVVTLAVYSYLLSALIGHQPVDISTGGGMEMYFPVFPFLQFMFYMGWLKVAETLLNPLGEDDDDFEVNYIVDRNLQVAYMIVDKLYNDAPELEKDIHWGDDAAQIPHTIASVGIKSDGPQGSQSHTDVAVADQAVLFQPSAPPSIPATPTLRSFTSQISHGEAVNAVKHLKNQISFSPIQEESSKDLIDSIISPDSVPVPAPHESITGIPVIDINDPVSIEQNKKSIMRLPKDVREQIMQHEKEVCERMTSIASNSEAGSPSLMRRAESMKKEGSGDIKYGNGPADT